MKLYKLNKELEKLKSKELKEIPIENMEILEFIKYKRILNKKNTIEAKIKEIQNISKNAEDTYNKLTTKWIEDPNIKCMKYSRMEKKAKYKKDKILYKNGVTKTHPVIVRFKENPIISNIYSKFQEHNFFKKISQKINNLRSNTIPQKINNLAIATAKQCISGYRAVEQDVKYFKYKTEQIAPIQYIKYIKNEAVRQLDSRAAHAAYVQSLNPQNYECNTVENTSNVIKNNSFISRKKCVEER